MENQKENTTRKFEEITFPPLMPEPPKEPPVKLETLVGKIKTMSAVPSHIPRNFYEQFIIYKSGATIRLYAYDNTNKAWNYTALT